MPYFLARVRKANRARNSRATAIFARRFTVHEITRKIDMVSLTCAQLERFRLAYASGALLRILSCFALSSARFEKRARARVKLITLASVYSNEQKKTKNS